MRFFPITWNERLMSIATFAVAVLFAFGGFGWFASGSTISGGFKAGLVGWSSLGDGYRASLWGPATAHWAQVRVVISQRWIIAARRTSPWARRMRGTRRSRGRCARCRCRGRIHSDSLDDWIAMEFVSSAKQSYRNKEKSEQFTSQWSQANANRVLDHKSRLAACRISGFPRDLTSAADHGRTNIGMVDSALSTDYPGTTKEA